MSLSKKQEKEAQELIESFSVQFVDFIDQLAKILGLNKG